MSIINNILWTMSEKGLKQIDLCNAIGVSSSTFTNWKNRETAPPAKYILPICEFLGVSFNYLMYGEDEKCKKIESNIMATGDVNNSKIVAGRDNNVFYSSEGIENNVYFELIKHLNGLSTSKRRHALADLMDILEEKYPIE